MSDTVPCPDCGHRNPAGSDHCQQCNFPLAAETVPVPEPVAGPAAEPPPSVPLPRRPRPRRPPPANQALSLWLLFGAVMAAIVIYIALKANVDRAHEPVEGANTDQTKVADQFREVLARDSSDVVAHIGLANVLYDTGNWSEAIVHYRAAIRRDSTNVHVLVDLGVCYYNLGQSEEAERLFRLALAGDPHQPVALFNLGIVHERRQRYAEALSYFHRALESAPPEEMKAAIVAAMQRVQEAGGVSPPPIPGGR